MEDQIKEALHNAGMTEEELTANGEAAKKAMEAKTEAAAASEAKVKENKNPEVQDIEKETDMNTTSEKKWDAKRIIKWTAITLGCVAVGIGAALLLKNREAVAEAAEATAEATE